MPRRDWITFEGVPLEIESDFYAGFPGSYWEPPEPESIELLSVVVEGTKHDILSLISDEAEGTLQKLIRRKLSDEREAALAERAAADKEYD